MSLTTTPTKTTNDSHRRPPMTTLDTRPDVSPTTTRRPSDAEFTANLTVKNTVNPHRWTTLTFGTAAILSAAGTTWAMYSEQDHPEWGFVLTMVFIWLATRAAIKFDQHGAANGTARL